MNYEQRENRSNLIKLVILTIIIIGVIYTFTSRTKSHSALAGLPDPVQNTVTGGQKMQVGNYDTKMTYLATYHIDALVVSTHSYSGGSFTDILSPMDVALIWGKVAEHNDKLKIRWSQAGRWYSWHASKNTDFSLIGGVGEVTAHSSNNHLIPSDDAIRDQIKKIKTGDHVIIDGYLVNLDGKKADGSTYYWHSSTTRSDDGDGSCEIIYVTKINIIK